MNSLTLLKKLGFKKSKFYKVKSNSKAYIRSLVDNLITEIHDNAIMEVDEYQSYYKHTDNKIYDFVTEKIIRPKGDSFWIYSLNNLNIWISVSNYNIETIYIEDLDTKNIKQFESTIKSKKDLLNILPKQILREIKLSQLKV